MNGKDMELQKIGVKVFAADSSDVALTDFIDIFHGWIQAADGVYHDVADYSHMHAGPGIVLVAHDVNLSIDESNNRRGLFYNRKSPLSGSNGEKIRALFRASLDNCRRLEQEPSLRGKLRFPADEFVISVNDRLLAPNTKQTFAALRPDIEAALRGLLGQVEFTLEHKDDPRQRFSVAVRASKPIQLDKPAAGAGAETRKC